MKPGMNVARESSVIVVGIDLGGLSKEVLGVAAQLAPRGSGRELHLVHVLPPPANAGLGAAPAEMGFVNQMGIVRASLDALGGPIAESVDRLVAHIRVGPPDVEIAQLATNLGAELIVVGTHGRKGIDRLRFGSVAESLVRNAPCPVLTYRPRIEAPWEQILPPCPDCLTTQRESKRARLWCERHAQHHPRAHTYYEFASGYGVGAQTFREP
jgi:nucleotide-binding universal stress UspA family protein